MSCCNKDCLANFTSTFKDMEATLPSESDEQKL
jgi:hypothetical protein